MRHRETCDYADLALVIDTAAQRGLPMPATYDHLDTIGGIHDALQGMTANEEGFVALFADGQRFKFKSAAYLELHKLVFGLTFRAALESVRDGKVEAIRQIVPEELRAEFDGWVEQIETRIAAVRAEVAAALAEATVAGVTGDRKAFALWAAAHYPQLRVYLFAALDGKPLEPIIFRLAFAE